MKKRGRTAYIYIYSLREGAKPTGKWFEREREARRGGRERVMKLINRQKVSVFAQH